jgi:cell division initiation protein
MKIAPIDIRQQRFAVKFRGFDPQEVDSFLEMVADELEELARENDQLKEKVRKFQREIEELCLGESDVKKTLLAAQTLKEEMSSNARKEAELIVRDAQSKASDLVHSTKSAATAAQEELAAMLRRKRQLILNMRSMMETHLRMLEVEEKSDKTLGEELEIPTPNTTPGLDEEDSEKRVKATASVGIDQNETVNESDSSASVFIPDEHSET